MIAGANLWDDYDPAAPPEWARILADAIRGMYPEKVASLRDHGDYSRYRDQPEAYIREVLKGEPIPKQVEIANLLLTPPYRVIVNSCNNAGKTFLSGSLINWWYDAYDPGVCITTAPTARAVVDTLWREVRTQRRTRWDFAGPKAPELYDRPDHYAKGYTGDRAEAFHGRHDAYMFFILDEATALDSYVWTGIKSMFKGNGKHHLLALLNPTDTTSPAYAESESGNYHTVRLSALEHPNVIAQLKGAKDPPIPAAVDTEMLVGWFGDFMMFEETRLDDFQAGDVAWPPLWCDQLPDGGKDAMARFGRAGKRVYYRPTPEGMARALGLWPTSSPGSVWSDLAWKCATRTMDGMAPLPIAWRAAPQIGCDVARGTATNADKVAIVVQIEGVAVHHEWGSGWNTARTHGRLIELAEHYAREYNRHRDPRVTTFLAGKQIPIKVDDGTFGGAVVDFLKAQGYWSVGVNASTASRDPTKYPIMRDQLWFVVPLAAREGRIDLSRLSKQSLAEIRKQCMAVRWDPDERGRRKVEKKEKTKERIHRSPDDADAMALAFYMPPNASTGAPVVFKEYRGPAFGPAANPLPGPFTHPARPGGPDS